MVANEMAVLLALSEHRGDSSLFSFQVLWLMYKAWLDSVAARQSHLTDLSGWKASLCPHGGMVQAPAQVLTSPVTVALPVPADA